MQSNTVRAMAGSPTTNTQQFNNLNGAATKHSGSSGAQSHASSSQQNSQAVQFNPIRLQSETLELIQTLSLDFDQLSPVEVRQKLRQLIQAEQEGRAKRESYLNEILHQRVSEEQARYREQFEKVRASFDFETMQFEKVLKDRAQGVIKALQIKQLDRLIDMVGRIRQVHNLHGGTNSSLYGPTCDQTQADLQSLITHIDGLMAELSSDDANSRALSEQFKNIFSQEELLRNTKGATFNPNLNDPRLFLQQQSSNGVVANNYRQQSHPAVNGAVRVGAATSYSGVTSGEGLPITSGSNILSPNTSPSQEFPQNQAEATLSNPQIQNMHRSNTTANQFVKPGTHGRPRFIYDLPVDFPFNEACIEKSLSNDLANSGLKSGSQGNGSHSQHTTSNHDVNPEDVLRTFTNSLHSGGTLGAIHSSLTYYKEALASKEWSNLSPSNAYQNFMWKKNLVGEIQKLAKEISRIPTEEAKILADLSKSHFSAEGSKRNFASGNAMHIGQPPTTSAPGQYPPPPGMTTAEAISKGLGFIGNNESSILMDLNRASIVAAQKEAEDLKQKAKRIVDDSATRLEPVVKSFTDAPISHQLMQTQHKGIQNQSSGSGGMLKSDPRFIKYQQQPSTSLPDSQCLFQEGSRQDESSQNAFQMMYQRHDHEDSSVNPAQPEMVRDSCVMFDVGYDDQPQSKPHKQRGNNKASPSKLIHPHLNYHASNERSQLSDEEDIDDDQVNHDKLDYISQGESHEKGLSRAGQVAQAFQDRVMSGHRRHGSVVVGEHTIQNAIEVPSKNGVQPNGKKDTKGRELNVYAERRSIQHERDELSPKQLRNESLSVQRSSIAAKRKVPQMGFFSNDQAQTFTDLELERYEAAQNFQQTTSFAPQNKQPWWLEDAHEIAQNPALFQQTAGPNMQVRTALASKLKSNRRRGTQSVNSQQANFASQKIGSGNGSASNNSNNLFNNRFGDQNLSNNALDNKGRAIKMNQGQDQTSGNLYDELSRVAEYQSSRSVLDGHSQKALRNPTSNLNRTMQVKKKSMAQGSSVNQSNIPSANLNREVICKSVVTNQDRTSPAPSGSVLGSQTKQVTGKMNIKKTQIKLVGGIQNKRSSIQVGGSSSTAGGNQSKSLSREGRLKVKLVAKAQPVPSNKDASDATEETGASDNLNVRRFSALNHGGASVNTSQSPKMSRNSNQRAVLATGPSKTSENKNTPGGVSDAQRQREFSPQLQNSGLGSVSHYTNKIPFKSTRQDVAKREEAGSAQYVHNNNFFQEKPIEENDEASGTKLQDLRESQDSSAQRQINNVSHLSAPMASQSTQIQQPLKIRRNRKQAKRMTPTIEDSTGVKALGTSFDARQQKQSDNEEQEDAEQQFKDIARNLRSSSQQQNTANIFIRKGSHHQAAIPTTNNQTSGAYGTAPGKSQAPVASGETMAIGAGKSRQGSFVRTFKNQKSRQGEDLNQSFGTERVSFHRSALMGNNQNTSRKGNSTQDGSAKAQAAAGFKRPAGTSNKSRDAVTMRVQSHSQPPFAGDQQTQVEANLDEPRIIPPPTEAFKGDEQRQDLSSTPGQMSGSGSLTVNAKRPVVKMTAINFIGPSSQPEGVAKVGQKEPQVSNFATVQNQVNSSTNSNFSFHHPQQPSQGKFATQAKKSPLPNQLDSSPYMTQAKVQGQAQNAASKRVIHLKRPSTNFQMASSNQPNLIGNKNAFAQRAASRVEHIDKKNELAFQNNVNNGATSGTSTISAIQRPTTQIRIGKKTSVGGTQQTQVVIGASRTNGNFMRPPSDLSDRDNSYM